MQTRDRVQEILERTGVLQHGHFVLSSGKHSNKYMQCAKIFQHPECSVEISKALAEKFEGYDVDIVIGPAVGGIILAYEVGRHMEVKAIYAERENGTMSLRRGFEIARRSKVLVVEDVISTGRSVKEVIDLVRSKGAEVVGVGSVVDRSAGKVLFDIPYKSVIKVDVETYEPSCCPLCEEGSIPLKPGGRDL